MGFLCVQPFRGSESAGLGEPSVVQTFNLSWFTSRSPEILREPNLSIIPDKEGDDLFVPDNQYSIKLITAIITFIFLVSNCTIAHAGIDKVQAFSRDVVQSDEVVGCTTRYPCIIELHC